MNERELQAANINNCLINALSMAIRGKEPSRQEILEIRTQLQAFGYRFGDMLFASERVIRLIEGVFKIQCPVKVHYQDIGDDNFLAETRGVPVHIYHRGNHFSHRRMW